MHCACMRPAMRAYNICFAPASRKAVAVVLSRDGTPALNSPLSSSFSVPRVLCARIFNPTHMDPSPSGCVFGWVWVSSLTWPRA